MQEFCSICNEPYTKDEGEQKNICTIISIGSKKPSGLGFCCLPCEAKWAHKTFVPYDELYENKLEPKAAAEEEESDKDKAAAEDDDDEEEEEEAEDGESEWEEVYHEDKRLEVAGMMGHFYMTYGGGPEGGYFVVKSEKVYKIERSWFTPYVIKGQVHGELEFNEGKCRVVPSE